MDKKFLEENNLNEAISHFKHLSEYKYPKQSLKKLYEYSFIADRGINEEGEENDNELQQPQGGNMSQNNDINATNQMGGMMGQQGGEMPTDGTEMPQNGNMMPPPMNNGMQDNTMPPPMNNGTQDNTMPPPMDNDMMPQEGGEEDIETQEMEPEDEVIDVDELTQSQEATEYKIDGVDDRLSKLYAVVKKFSDQLDKNAESIQALKTEFEKRNPTEEEKLNIRSQSSYPYSETPKGYWEQKMKENPHYNIMYNNEIAPNEEQKKFNITKDDISGLDMKSISDTLDVDQNLKKYIGF